jgi:hypothetical protein
MLDAVSKIVMMSDDPMIAAKHPTGLKGVDNLEIIDVQEGKKGLWQPDTFPRSFQLFDNAVNEWWLYAQTVGSSHDPLMGIEAKAGTPFRAQERQVIEGKSVHEYRKGKYAKFVEKVYRELFLPKIADKITQGMTFLSELDLKEMQQVAENVVTLEANKLIKKMVLAGQTVDPGVIEQFKQSTRETFMKDNKKFIKILKGEIKKLPLKVKVNVAGKQKNLGEMVDKMSNVLRYVFSTFNPQTGQFMVFQDPKMMELFNQMLEYSGMRQIDASTSKPQLQQPQMPQAQPPAQPQQMMAQQNAVQV